ncbi:hypothetical protein [Georgenia daeguensis]|uniref:Uncharacterized protein n=1 Tax=Georgenia daeguensis TaxID=908355 RepID=A0ABP8EWM0_9MICO
MNALPAHATGTLNHDEPPRWHAAAHRWPAVVGLAAAALVLVGTPDREVPALVVGVAALCYLGAAALGRPWVAWALVPALAALVTVAELLGVAWWAAVAGAAVVLLVAGVLRGAPRAPLSAQSAALLGFGGLAAVALLLDAPRIGLALAGLTLATHAVWDAVHLRRRQVVPRSLAEACLFLDVPAGVGFVALALAG